uniref:SMI1/KNR4 family protein n=1 Tax=Agathobacter sp. TaxID=2021311 RepID=UPI004056903C
MRDKIINMISSKTEVFENAFLMRFPTEKELSEAKDQLGFNIPDEYVWFLKTYGHGGFFFEFLGYGINGNAILVEKTLYERKFGLPTELLVIENCDEYVVCIDSSTGKVVSWSKHDKDGVIVVANDFYEYFMDRVENAIANF